MAYSPRKKKISQFTAGTAITDDVKYSSLQDGINKTFTHEQLIAGFADVYGASLRTFEFESDLVVSDIQIDEYCIVEENRYTLYKITSAAANLPNIALDSGFTAERVRILQQASPSTYAEILAENPDLYAEDDVIYLSGDGIAGDFKVVASAISASSTGVQLSNATWNAAGKHLARVTDEPYNPIWFGAAGDGSTDDLTAISSAITAANTDGVKHVVLGHGYTFIISDSLSIPSSFTLEINGTLKLAASTADDTAMIVNSDTVSGNTGIVITGKGSIDGNKSNQATGSAIRHSCIFFQNVTDCLISVRQIGSNKWDNAYASTPASGFEGAVSIMDAIRCKIEGVLFYLFEHEACKIEEGSNAVCYGNMISDCIFEGSGAASYSGPQIVGPNAYGNSMSNIIVRNTGASGFSLDSKYSSVSNMTIYRNGFQPGANFGHSGQPASYSSATNITVYDAGNLATSGTTHHGISIGSGTVGMSLSNFVVDGAFNSGLNISSNANTIQVSNGRITNVDGNGITLFNADNTKIRNVFIDNVGASNISVSGTSDGVEYEINGVSNFRYHTAAITCGTSGTVTLSSAADILSYTRKGNVVTIQGNLRVASVSSPVGNFRISLPFEVADLADDAGQSSGSIIVHSVAAANCSDFVMVADEGNSYATVYLGDGTSLQSDSAQELQTNSEIIMSLTYFCA